MDVFQIIKEKDPSIDLIEEIEDEESDIFKLRRKTYVNNKCDNKYVCFTFMNYFKMFIDKISEIHFMKIQFILTT